ncbi:sialidase family protein [Halospeciosus flavus]|uniref:Uncharacterized protein n=1 Tax=Halospeciosus flavus TaxID=3032283 RepID=A0ABD5Z7Y3_9EURY|nr:hypothetical protein [Halospeciosus flavus]
MVTRRALLKTMGSAAGAGGVAVTTNIPASREKNGWRRVRTPTQSPLYDAALSAVGPVAVGGSGVVLLRRPGEWLAVLEHGPAVSGADLLGAAATDDRRRVWFCGGGGAVGYVDVAREEVVDHSAPGGKTSSWEGVSVVGDAGNERVFLVNGSGEFVAGDATGSGVNWHDVVPTDAEAVHETHGVDVLEPGGGSSALGIDFSSTEHGLVCDTTSHVYETDDAGTSWETVGVEGASVGLLDVATAGRGSALVAGDDGTIFRRDADNWTPVPVGEDAIHTVRTGSRTMAAGGAGRVYEGDDGWTTTATPTSATLHGVVYDPEGNYPDTAVGGSGTVVEHGAYEGELPHTIEITGSDGATTYYRFRVTDRVAASDDTGSVEVSDGDTASGLVGDDTDTFGFSGSIASFAVTAGDPADLTVTVDGEERDVYTLGAPSWTTVDSPVGNGLHDVAHARDGPLAVGESGVLVQRGDDGWVVVAKDGPAGAGRDLLAAAGTDGGGAVWVVGVSGALVRYTPGRGARDGDFDEFDHPEHRAGTLRAVGVVGSAGSEHVAVVDGSDEVFLGAFRGDGVDWNGSRPPTGADVTDVTLVSSRTASCVTSDGGVFYTRDRGTSWTRVRDADDTALTSLAADGDRVHAAGADGTVARYDGSTWTRRYAGGSLHDVAARDGTAVAVGESGGVYRRLDWKWRRDRTPTENSLDAISFGRGDAPAVVVGGSGTILEGRR